MVIAMMAGGGTMKSGGTQPAGTVTVSGEPQVSGTYLEETGIRFNSDGTIDKVVGAVVTQIDSGTDWIIPNGDAPDLFEVMTDNYVDEGGDTSLWETSAAGTGVWISLLSNRLWSVLAAGPGGGDSHGFSFDAHIRWNGGATIDTGSYSIISEFS